jgi:hypothetical protein
MMRRRRLSGWILIKKGRFAFTVEATWLERRALRTGGQQNPQSRRKDLLCVFPFSLLKLTMGQPFMMALPYRITILLPYETDL